jgi:hypothetical protein
LDNAKINQLYNSILTGITELGANTTPSKPSAAMRYKKLLMFKVNGIPSEKPVKKGGIKSRKKGGRKSRKKGGRKSTRKGGRRKSRRK